MRLERQQQAAERSLVPLPVEGRAGWVMVDATWGTVQPIELTPGLRTVGELEVIAKLRRGTPVLDTRPADAYRAQTIPGARSLPWEQAAERAAELDPQTPAVLFCNGPQCLATPNAVDALLAAGHPPSALLYYRGGLHDWMTLGFPVVGEDAL